MKEINDLFSSGGFRKSDPDTSREAAARVGPKLSVIQSRVLTEFTCAAGHGLTDYELENNCGASQNRVSTYRSRRRELCDVGLIRDSGLRRVQAGRNRIVWVLASCVRG